MRRRRLMGVFLATTLLATGTGAVVANAAHLPCTLSYTGPTTDGNYVYGTSTLSCGSVGRTGDWVKVQIWEDDIFPDPDDLKAEATNNTNALTMVVNKSWNCNGTGDQTYYLKGSARDTTGSTYSYTTGTTNLNC
jgi:hypothetical protein